MTLQNNGSSILPHENDILEGLDNAGYFKAIEQAKLSKKKFIESLISLQEEERKKLGHELHDSVNSSLSIAKVYLKLLPSVTKKQKYAKEQLSNIITNAEQSIRSISCNLVISQEVETGIAELIQNLVRRISGLDLFQINFKCTSTETLDSISVIQKIVLYRIAQEQLNNIIKYSKATSVNIVLNQGATTENSIYLKIEDNGQGFEPAKKANGIGLSNIITRVKQFNGKVSILSSPGAGCKIEITMPVMI